MYKLSQAAALVFTLLFTVAAQGGEANKGQGGERGGDRLARMQQHLGLSDDQVSQIRDIRANGGGREEVSQVLTEEQRTQLEEHRSEHRQQHRDKHRRQVES